MFNIRWAPLNVPLRRRLQTLSIFIFSFIASYGIFAGYIFFILLLSSRLWWLGAIYILYALQNNFLVGYYSNKRSEWFRSWRIWEYCMDYFPIKLVKTTDLDPSKNYLVLTYPHGLLMISQWFLATTNAIKFKEKYPGLTTHLATVPGRFCIPFEREMLVYGGICVADEECLLYLLDNKKHKGNFVMMNTGASAEVMLTSKEQYNLYLKNRKGFARIAFKTGASLVPMFSFNENKLYDGVAFKPNTFLGKVQRWVRDRTKFALIPPLGRGFFQYSFGTIPHRIPVHIVVGAPLEVPQVPEPTREQIDELHARFVSALRALYDEHKHKYEPDPNTPLNIL